MSQNNRNLVLEELARGYAARTRVAKLESALRALLHALDTQHLGGLRPGQFIYSGNVTDAQRFARTLVLTPANAPEPEAHDIAKEVP